MLKKDQNKHSAEVNDLINGKPGWLVRNGVTLFFLILAAFCVATYFIKYPNIVTTEVTIFQGETTIPGNADYFCEVQVPETEFTTLKPGQELVLKLSAYPYEKFGFVEGRIEMISNMPADNRYLIKINLPNGLVTNYNRKLLYTTGMKGKAEIITKYRRLSDILIDKTRKLFQ